MWILFVTYLMNLLYNSKNTFKRNMLFQLHIQFYLNRFPTIEPGHWLKRHWSFGKSLINAKKNANQIMVGKTIETHWLVKKLIDFRKKLMNYEISLSTRTFLRCKKSSQNHDKDTPNIFYGFHDKPLTRRALYLLRSLFLYTSLYCLLALFFINR